jgi:hypothetical protein
MEYISIHVPVNEILPHMCCAAHKIATEAEKMLKVLCASKTGDFSRSYVTQLIRSMSGETLDLGCGRYANLDSCQIIMPEYMNLIQRNWNIVERNKTKFAYSPMVPLLNVMKRLDSDDLD